MNMLGVHRLSRALLSTCVLAASYVWNCFGWMEAAECLRIVAWAVAGTAY